MPDIILNILAASWDVFLESAPYMLFGFLAAGLLRAFLPADLVSRHLGGSRLSGVLKASLLGAPIPLCSCGVAPAAAGLRRQGASRGSTAAFLISTPETGVDSLAITWALLDPVMTLLRPLAALITATVAGIGVNALERPGSGESAPAGDNPLEASCSGCGCDGSCATAKPGLAHKLRSGIRYAFTDLLPDIGGWFVLGVLLAGALTALMPPGLIERYLGDGLLPLLAALVVAAPLYVCATSSTPIVAALALKGLSPGAALVFLLAGPATNLASFGMVSKIIGRRAALVYLGSILICSLLLGLAANELYAALGFSTTAWARPLQAETQGPLHWISALVLAALLAAPFAGNLINRCRRRCFGGSSTPFGG
ncbi:SO_0444 family Cu/Zn efflux transporter [Paucidesulfovibrio longus]|uniref:SO_0444 family Cu/Zn efflux transporter n=1 Tax=Paucidesulfovibrio longus TaxID=889 RepID=UPI0003B31FB5|nr:SO_0444 family Cu/Zn efflux transporter [Paucidesulfovibrio longus]